MTSFLRNAIMKKISKEEKNLKEKNIKIDKKKGNRHD